MSDLDPIQTKIADTEHDLQLAKDVGDRELILTFGKRLTGLEEDLRIRRNEMRVKAQVSDSFALGSFDLFGHGIGMAQLVVGVLGLGTVIAGGGLYAARQHHKATGKFFNSLLVTSENKLSKIRYSVLTRGAMKVGIGKEQVSHLNLNSAHRSVALVGVNRSGKTTFLAHTILPQRHLSLVVPLCVSTTRSVSNGLTGLRQHQRLVKEPNSDNGEGQSMGSGRRFAVAA